MKFPVEFIKKLLEVYSGPFSRLYQAGSRSDDLDDDFNWIKTKPLEKPKSKAGVHFNYSVQELKEPK